MQPRAEDTFADPALNHDDVRRRAYEIHLECGGLSGRELADWLQAEAELGKSARLRRTTNGAKQQARDYAIENPSAETPSYRS
jgi:Protein of unknown function (DUF2934)